MYSSATAFDMGTSVEKRAPMGVPIGKGYPVPMAKPYIAYAESKEHHVHDTRPEPVYRPEPIYSPKPGCIEHADTASECSTIKPHVLGPDVTMSKEEQLKRSKEELSELNSEIQQFAKNISLACEEPSNEKDTMHMINWYELMTKRQAVLKKRILELEHNIAEAERAEAEANAEKEAEILALAMEKLELKKAQEKEKEEEKAAEGISVDEIVSKAKEGKISKAMGKILIGKGYCFRCYDDADRYIRLNLIGMNFSQTISRDSANVLRKVLLEGLKCHCGSCGKVLKDVLEISSKKTSTPVSFGVALVT